MATMPSPTQSGFFAASLRVGPSVEAPAVRPAKLEKDEFASGSLRLGKLNLLAFTSYLIAVCAGVAATLAWQSYGDAAREAIVPAASSPAQLQRDAVSLDLDAVRQSIDAIAASLAASQEQMKRRVDQLAVGHEWMARDFDSKLQAAEQNILDKISAPPPRAAPAPARNPVGRQPTAPMVRSDIP
jgi:hypothetical protein